MEPQDNFYCYDNREKKCCNGKNCYGIISTILLVAFAVVIGLIIGATNSAAIIAALPAVIVLAVVLGLLFILSIILYICEKYRKCKKRC